MFTVNNTPVEEHNGIWVKREDLSCPEPGPKFSKIRGAVEHIASRPESVIGVLDTFHSKAGWGVAYACSLLGKKCVNFYPVYKAEGTLLSHNLRPSQQHAQDLGANMVPLQAGRSSILYHQAKKLTQGLGGYIMPNALKLSESVEGTRQETLSTECSGYDNLVISVSSGTIAAGVLLGLMDLGERPHVYLHMGYDRSESELLAYVTRLSGYPEDRITPINEGYGYKDKARDPVPAPFPCNPYYDLKAWTWLQRHPLPGKTLFWNIGE